MIDTHCHLTDERYENADEIIKAFEQDGLKAVVCVGYNAESSKKSIELAKKYDRVFAAVGVHPSDITNKDEIDKIKSMLIEEKVVALGEIGLDYHWEEPPRDVQREGLRKQLELAIETKLPVIIHSRDCDGDMLPIMKEYKNRLSEGLIMHCFSSSAELAKEYVKMGFYISFAGPITYKNAKRGEAIRAVPDELLLAETDCPYLTPMPHRGKLNYPAYVRYTMEKLAEERNTDFQKIEEITTANALRIFKKMKLKEARI